MNQVDEADLKSITPLSDIWDKFFNFLFKITKREFNIIDSWRHHEECIVF